MQHEELTMDDFKGTAALMRAADYIISFERTVMKPDEYQYTKLYRSQMNAGGEWELVEVGAKKRREGPQMFGYDPTAQVF